MQKLQSVVDIISEKFGLTQYPIIESSFHEIRIDTIVSDVRICTIVQPRYYNELIKITFEICLPACNGSKGNYVRYSPVPSDYKSILMYESLELHLDMIVHLARSECFFLTESQMKDLKESFVDKAKTINSLHNNYVVEIVRAVDVDSAARQIGLYYFRVCFKNSEICQFPLIIHSSIFTGAVDAFTNVIDDSLDCIVMSFSGVQLQHSKSESRLELTLIIFFCIIVTFLMYFNFGLNYLFYAMSCIFLIIFIRSVYMYKRYGDPLYH